MIKSKSLLGFMAVITAILVLAVNYFLISVGNLADQGRSKSFYVYGLWRMEAFNEFKSQLEPYGVSLVGRGCVIGTDQYERDMRSNQLLIETASGDLRKLLGPKSKAHSFTN